MASSFCTMATACGVTDFVDRSSRLSNNAFDDGARDAAVPVDVQVGDFRPELQNS
jgi:hypothetical protein